MVIMVIIGDCKYCVASTLAFRSCSMVIMMVIVVFGIVAAVFNYMDWSLVIMINVVVIIIILIWMIVGDSDSYS